jgi:hypothetical protein
MQWIILVEIKAFPGRFQGHFTHGVKSIFYLMHPAIGGGCMPPPPRLGHPGRSGSLASQVSAPARDLHRLRGHRPQMPTYPVILSQIARRPPSLKRGISLRRAASLSPCDN